MGSYHKADELLRFNIKYSDGNKVNIETGEITKVVDASFEREPLYKLWHVLYSISDIEELHRLLRLKFGIDDETVVEALCQIDFVKAGYGNKSVRAMRKILPYLQKGMQYYDAKVAAGYDDTPLTKASVLLAGSAMIGAVLGNASENDCRKIYRYALELGLAFQQQDDLLDSYGTIEELGKRIGGDILEGKKTCLMLNAMSRATEEDRDILRSTHLDATLSDDEKIARVKEVYDRYDIQRTIQQQITLRFERALSILDTLEIPAEQTEHQIEFRFPF